MLVCDICKSESGIAHCEINLGTIHMDGCDARNFDLCLECRKKVTEKIVDVLGAVIEGRQKQVARVRAMLRACGDA